MNGSGCKNCPVSPCHTLYYRGSYCCEQRAKRGLGDPITNADRIRSMTDEELAELLANETYRIAEPCFDAFGYGLEKQVIYAKRLEWLQQPAEKPKEDS